MSISHECTICLPAWMDSWVQGRSQGLTGSEACMRLAIDLSAENVRQGTGGPFGAAVIDTEKGELVSVGVNLVTSAGLSIAHAEMVAISLAQSRLGAWNLASEGSLTLVTSCEPCAMCFGAVPWSGVRKLICGATKADAEAAGFDEGDKPDDWVESLLGRNIEVETGVLHEDATAVFDHYRKQGGVIYNAGSGR